MQSDGRSARMPRATGGCSTLLGAPADTLIVMEATGHYWQNLFAALAAEGFAVALLNPLAHAAVRQRGHGAHQDRRDRRARASPASASRSGPRPRRCPDVATEDLRELVRLRTRFLQDFGDRIRQLHRAVDLSFPEFTRYVAQLDSASGHRAAAGLPHRGGVPRRASERQARRAYDGGAATVGRELAQRPRKPRPARSVGRHDTAVYARQVRYFCEDLDLLRRRLRGPRARHRAAYSRARGGTLAHHHRRHRPPDRRQARRRTRRPRRLSQRRRARRLRRRHPRSAAIRQADLGSRRPDAASATPSCARRSGCPRSLRSAATPGCGRTTSVCALAASCPRSP